MNHYRSRRDEWRDALDLVRCGLKHDRTKPMRRGVSGKVRRKLLLRGYSCRLLSRYYCAPRFWMRGDA
jgi:hypothetical protein